MENLLKSLEKDYSDLARDLNNTILKLLYNQQAELKWGWLNEKDNADNINNVYFLTFIYLMAQHRMDK